MDDISGNMKAYSRDLTWTEAQGRYLKGLVFLGLNYLGQAA